MKVLVTGGAGYIGSHTCKALAAAGHTPIAYDNLSCGHRWAVKWGPFEYGDIRDAARLGDVLTKHKVDAIIHFAALAYVGESTQFPELYYRVNVGGTINLLDLARQHGIGKFVFSSTCATYRDPERVPITESENQSPVNPYGRTKLLVEQILRDLCDYSGFGATALRYFNAAGGDPDGEIGEEHDPETHLIPIILQAAAGKRDTISVFGTDYDTPDGTCIRDYIHVTDLADAHLRALESIREGEFRAFNLGNGKGFSVLEVIEIAKAVTGKPIDVVMADRRPGDPPNLVADATKAKSELGWNPKYDDLEQIVGTAWNWMSRND